LKGETIVEKRNWDHRFLSFSCEAGSLANYRGALVRRPVKLSRRMFVLNAAPRDNSSTAWSWKPDGPWQDGLDDQQTTVWYLHRAPLSDEDLRIHAYVSERLAVLHRERHGLWSKIRRLLAMITHRNIQALALVLIVAATTAPKAEAQRFRGGGFGVRSGFRTSFGYGSRPLRGFTSGYTSGGFRTGYGFRSYGYAPYRSYGYGLFGRDRDFRWRYGYGYPYAYGYPFVYGWGYGYPYAGYGSPYEFDGGYGPSDAGGWTAPTAGAADQGQNAAAPLDRILGAAGAPALMGRLQWPLGLAILPGAGSFRERIDGLYTTAASQALTGNLNPQLPSQMKQAVKELSRLVASDKQERLTLSSAMYEQAEDFLRQLTRSAGRFSALESSRPPDSYAIPAVPAKK